MRTVTAYLPSLYSSLQNASPPPAAPSFVATSANTPTGANIITKYTSFRTAALTPSKNLMTGRPFSPSVVKMPPKTSETTMSGRTFVSAAAAKTFSGIMLTMTSTTV